FLSKTGVRVGASQYATCWAGWRARLVSGGVSLSYDALDRRIRQRTARLPVNGNSGINVFGGRVSHVLSPVSTVVPGGAIIPHHAFGVWAWRHDAFDGQRLIRVPHSVLKHWAASIENRQWVSKIMGAVNSIGFVSLKRFYATCRFVNPGCGLTVTSDKCDAQQRFSHGYDSSMASISALSFLALQRPSAGLPARASYSLRNASVGSGSGACSWRCADSVISK